MWIGRHEIGGDDGTHLQLDFSIMVAFAINILSLAIVIFVVYKIVKRLDLKLKKTVMSNGVIR